MWDPESGVKFATNEPLRPFFRDSQITKFVEDNRGQRRPAHRLRRDEHHLRPSKS